MHEPRGDMPANFQTKIKVPLKIFKTIKTHFKVCMKHFMSIKIKSVSKRIYVRTPERNNENVSILSIIVGSVSICNSPSAESQI